MSINCTACRDGEHDNYDDNVMFVKVINPDTNLIIQTAYLCESHRECYLDDGFEIDVIS